MKKLVLITLLIKSFIAQAEIPQERILGFWKLDRVHCSKGQVHPKALPQEDEGLTLEFFPGSKVTIRVKAKTCRADADSKYAIVQNKLELSDHQLKPIDCDDNISPSKVEIDFEFREGPRGLELKFNQYRMCSDNGIAEWIFRRSEVF